MTIAKTVEKFLNEHAVRYKVLEHPRSMSSRETANASHLPPSDIAKAVVLGDDKGYVMAVLPSDRHVELHKLAEKLGRSLDLVSEARLGAVFKDCEPGAIPPLGPAYNMETIVDESLVGHDKIWFVAGDHDRLCAVSGEDFVRLLSRARFARFSH
jgi:Ala-tRNA(Pro) deacylase